MPDKNINTILSIIVNGKCFVIQNELDKWTPPNDNVEYVAENS